VWDSNPR